jgi:serine/threonine protein kinase/tetratricopeptide (TPR) repeat protein
MSTVIPGSLDENVRRQFEAAWRAGRPEPIEQYLLPQDHPAYLATLEELVHIDMEFAWKRGRNAVDSTIDYDVRPPLLEAYLDRFPRLNEPAIVLRLAEQEFRVRRRAGDQPTVAEYQERFPKVIVTGEEFLSLIQSLDTLDEVPVTGRMAGERLGRYRLAAEHARGGFGLVWRAHDENLGREVAVKQLSEELANRSGYRQRFMAEARIAAQLQHPGIVPVYDLGEPDDAHPYYTMKLVRGQTLVEAIRRFHSEALSPGEKSVERLRLLTAFLAVTRAMAFAHARGIIHRDLKPANIILGDFGETVILDWGLAKEIRRPQTAEPEPSQTFNSSPSDLTQPGTVMGTPAYMAPEQAAGRIEEVDERSDIYALGAILFQILTGRPPFRHAESDKVLELVIKGELDRPSSIDPGVPKPLDAICLKAMANQAGERYGDVATLTRDLERYLADEPVSVYCEHLTERLGRWARRHRPTVVAVSVAAVLVMVGSVCGLFLWQKFDHDRQLQIEKNRAELQKTVESERDFAVAELRSGRFASAEKMLFHAVKSLEGEPALDVLHGSLRERWQRAHGLVEFYRLADLAEKFAFLEFDLQALAACEAALDSLGILHDRDWGVHLPAEDLTDPSDAMPGHLLTQLREDVYRSFMLLSALRIRPHLTKKASDPALQQACRSALEAVDAYDHYRPSFSGHLIKLFCHMSQGQLTKLARNTCPEPTSAADYYFAGMAHVWVASAGQNDIIKQLLGNPMGRMLTGLDFSHPRQTSERYLRAASDLEPKHYWTQLWLAWSFSVAANRRPAGDSKTAADYLEAAAQAYDTCVALRPDYALGYGERGRILVNLVKEAKDAEQQKNFERRGLQDLDRARSLEPHEPFIHWLRADAFKQLERVPENLEALAAALDLEPGLAVWQGQRIGMEKRWFMERTVQWATSMAQTDPSNANAWAVLARAQLFLDKAREAMDAATRALELRPDHPLALTVRGMHRLQAKQFEAALSDFTRALGGVPETYLAAAGQAQALQGLGRWEESLSSLDRLLKTTRPDWQVEETHHARGRVLTQLGRADEAGQAEQKAPHVDVKTASGSR